MRSSPRFRSAALLAAAVTLAATSTACSDKSSTGPDPVAAASQEASRFDRLSDSLSNAGSSEDADRAQATADLIRIIGRVDNVVVKVDGRSVTHRAIAVEFLVPASACDNTSDPAYCRDYYPAFEQAVVGWSGSDLREGFSVYSDQAGTTSAFYDESGPDPLAGVFYSQRDVNADDTDNFGLPSRGWYSEDGTVTMNLATPGAACNLPSTVDPAISYTCKLMVTSPSFDVTASELFGDLGATPRHLTMAPQRIDGVTITIIEAYDPLATAVARPTESARLKSARAVHALLQRIRPRVGRAPARR